MTKVGNDLVFKFSRRVIISHILIFIVGIIGLYFSTTLTKPYNYILVNPSFFNENNLSWLTNVWIGVLSIHGTIAALSITFMGMFVSQVSTYAEFGFESICRVILLRKYNFLKFSIESISGLLCGLLLLVIGCGLLFYFISVLISLYFIINYSVMYYRLYNLTEKPSIITELLFERLKDTGILNSNLDIRKNELANKFSEELKKSANINKFEKRDYITQDITTLDIFTSEKNSVISGYIPERISELDKEIQKINEMNSGVINIDFTIFFSSPLFNSSVSIIHAKELKIEKENITTLENLVKKIFIFTETPNIHDEFKQFESAIIVSINNSLHSNNEFSLDFGIRAIDSLVSNDNLNAFLRNLDISISSSNKKDFIDFSILAKLFEKLSSTSLAKNNVSNAVTSMNFTIDLARYIYTQDYFYEFYRTISRHLQNRVRYNYDDEDYQYLDLYLRTVVQNLVSKNLKAFILDTDFITKNLRYLQQHTDQESLTKTQHKLLLCLKEIISMLIIRIEYIRNKENTTDEISNLKYFFKSWLNSRFIEDIYYKKETYEILFLIPHEHSMFRAERALREIPDEEATWVSITNDTYKAISLLLTQSSLNKNNLNLIFVRNTPDFFTKTKILTHDLNSIHAYLLSDEFSNLISYISDKETDKSKQSIVAASVKKIIAGLDEIIIKSVTNSKLNAELIKKYIDEVSLSIEKHLDILTPTINVPVIDFPSEKFKTVLIEKREVIPPIDGVFYSMNAENHGQNIVYSFVRKILEIVKNGKPSFKKISSTDELPPHGLITIEYMIASRINTYRHSKGIKMNDKEGYLMLGEPGMYYLNIFENFTLQRKRRLVDVNINDITTDNASEIVENFSIGGQNPMLFATMSIFLNLLIEEKNPPSLYFLTEEDCKQINEQQERYLNQITELKNQAPDSDSVS
ncbi:UNVERIFIED_ORG: hypothetical protein M2414_000032 [Rahnella aquatilis]